MTTHTLSKADRTIAFEIEGDGATIREGETEATTSVAEARAFYAGLLERGWLPPSHPKAKRKLTAAERMRRAMAGSEA